MRSYALIAVLLVACGSPTTSPTPEDAPTNDGRIVDAPIDGANCTTCTDSALKAYKMEKEQRMTPEQIREALIKEYSNY